MTGGGAGGHVRRLFGRAAGGPAGNVIRGMATLVAGNASARLIGILTIPVTTRLFTPDDFGVLAVFVSLVMILAPALTLRYVMAVPLPRRDSVAFNLMALSLLVSVVMSLILALLLWWLGPWLFRQLSMESLNAWWWLIPVGLIAVASCEAMTLWATRRRVYPVIAKSLTLQSVAGNGTKILLGMLSLQPLGLLIGQVVVSGGAVIPLWLRFRRELGGLAAAVSYRRLRMVALRYRDFPAYRLPSHVMLMLGMQAPLLLSALVFEPAVVGQLSLALLAVAMPVDLLANSMGKAYLAEIAAIGRQDPDRVLQITRAITLRMFALSVPLVAIMFFFSEPLFVLVFGAEWALAGQFCSILAVYILFNFVSNPIQHVFSVFRQNRVYLWLSVQRLVIVGILFGVSVGLGFTAFQWVMVYSVGLSLHYVLVCLRVFRCLRSQRTAVGATPDTI